jgi:hypothetical protein
VKFKYPHKLLVLNFSAGIWTIIRGLLDPVVASKIHFTKSVEDLEKFIPRSQMIKEMGGDEDWDYQYVEPQPGENDRLDDIETRNRLLRERESMIREYEVLTAKWINGDSHVQAKRCRLSQALMDHYRQKLDRYLRAATLYDRLGDCFPK